MKINIHISPVETPQVNFETLVDVLNEEGKDYCYYKSNLDSYSFTAYDFIALPVLPSEDPLCELVTIEPVVHQEQQYFPLNLLHAIPIVFDTRPFDQLESVIWKSFAGPLFMPRSVFLESHSGSFFITLNRDENNSTNPTLEFELLKNKLAAYQSTESQCAPADKAGIEKNILGDREAYMSKISEAKRYIKSGAVEKVVLARKISIGDVILPHPSYLLRKMNAHEHAHRFIYRRNGAVFFGASPELLFAYQDGKLFSEALAGTIERADVPCDDEERAKTLGGSRKDGLEQQFVVRHIVFALQKYSRDVRFDEQPRIRQTRKLFHLRTRIFAKNILRQQLPDVFKEIFPTPAVCGTPKEKAKEIITEIEAYERGLYGGAFGWLNAGTGIMYFVPLRCAVHYNHELNVFAGGGIVADSDAAEEYREATSKAKSVLSMVFDED